MHETASWLAQLRDVDAHKRQQAINALAQPQHHDAIPQLVAWLSVDEYIYYDEKEYYGTYNDSVKLHTEALRALRRIGEAALPALLQDLRERITEKNPHHIALLSELMTRRDKCLTQILVQHHKRVGDVSSQMYRQDPPFDTWDASDLRYHYHNRVAYLRNVVRPALAKMHTLQSWRFSMAYATIHATQQARLIWLYRVRGWRLAPLVWLLVPIMFLANVFLRLPTVLLRKGFLHTRS